MRGWGNVRDVGSEGRGEFMGKIEPGSEIVIHVLDEEPLMRVQHWIGDRTEACRGPVCGMCKGGNKPTQKFAINVYDYKSGKVKIFQQGSGVFSQMNAVRKAYKNTLKDVDLTIARKGSTKENTRYTVVPVPTQIGTVNTATLKKHDLEAVFDDNAGSAQEPEDTSTPF